MIISCFVQVAWVSCYGRPPLAELLPHVNVRDCLQCLNFMLDILAHSSKPQSSLMVRIGPQMNELISCQLLLYYVDESVLYLFDITIQPKAATCSEHFNLIHMFSYYYYLISDSKLMQNWCCLQQIIEGGSNATPCRGLAVTTSEVINQFTS